jgi:Ion channel
VADRPALRHTLAEHGLTPKRHGYGLLLLLILLSLGFQLGASESDLTHSITIALQGGTFLAALWISQGRTRALRVASAVVIALTVAAAVGLAASGGVDDAGARAVSLVLVVVTQGVILSGVVTHVREEGRITVQTMFGVLCIYLLIGPLFAFTYGLIDNLADSPFFAQIDHADTSDYLYFSFTTQTTTGFGDLTAATDLGRSFAIIEELLGQIYMVTVVALIVSGLGASARERRA